MGAVPIYIAGIGTAFGDEMPIATATATGAYCRSEAAHSRQTVVRVAAEGTTAADLAARAVGTALRRADVPLQGFGPLFNAAIVPDLADVATPASVHAAAGLPPTCRPTFSTSAGHDAVILALAQASTYLRLTSNPAVESALITAASVIPADPDRWTLYPRGDGAGALVITRRPARARLLSCAVQSDSVLQALPELNAEPKLVEQQNCNLAQIVLGLALDRAGVRCADVRYVIVPFTGGYNPARRAYAMWPDADDLRPEPFAAYGRTIGRLGPADLICGLDLLGRPEAPIDDGDHVLLLAHSERSTAAAAVIQF